MEIDNTPIADITRLADITHLINSIHTTRAILCARLQTIAESLPQIPEPINQAAWLTDSPYYGRVELSVSNLELMVHYTPPREQYWRLGDIPACLIGPTAREMEEMLTKLQEALAAKEKEEVVALAEKL